jgi:hypothetical protein
VWRYVLTLSIDFIAASGHSPLLVARGSRAVSGLELVLFCCMARRFKLAAVNVSTLLAMLFPLSKKCCKKIM